MELRAIETDKIAIPGQNTGNKLKDDQKDSSLQDLGASIREKGLLQPIIVQAAGESYELISGQCRLLACQRIAMRSIPAIVRSGLDDTDASAISLIENVHQADMAPSDKARAFQKLSEHYAGDHERVSKETGVSVGTIRKYLSLLALPPTCCRQVMLTRWKECGPIHWCAGSFVTRMGCRGLCLRSALRLLSAECALALKRPSKIR
jgi:ParB family chromosome partitioning protein